MLVISKLSVYSVADLFYYAALLAAALLVLPVRLPVCNVRAGKSKTNKKAVL